MQFFETWFDDRRRLRAGSDASDPGRAEARPRGGGDAGASGQHHRQSGDHPGYFEDGVADCESEVRRMVRTQWYCERIINGTGTFQVPSARRWS